jgi:lysozyme family protein
MYNLYFVTDVEATGPDFATHNMYQFATVPVLPDGTTLPGITFDLAFATPYHNKATLTFLEHHLGFTVETWSQQPNLTPPKTAMAQLSEWVITTLDAHNARQPIFVSDNLAFDWGYMHTYLHRFHGYNPFGYAGRNLPCLSLGFYGSRDAWEQFRTKPHTHDALEDTEGNAGAFVKMIQDGLKV